MFLFTGGDQSGRSPLFGGHCNTNGALGQVYGDSEAGLALLRAVGADLDLGVTPLVFAGGVVRPGAPSSNHQPGETERSGDERTREGAPGIRAWQGGSSGSWATAGEATARSRSAGTTSQVLSRLAGEGIAALSGVEEAYPRVWTLSAPDMTVLFNEITPIEGLPDTALLVTAWPSSADLWPTSWAWWIDGIWIGPRHTNYPNGSICAFEIRDWTWRRGDSAILLLDLQAVWLTRHLFLRRFGRWPGQQVLHTPHERLLEQVPDELCGGCKSGKRYSECHRNRDVAVGELERLREFSRFRGQVGPRRPPPALISWLDGSGVTPRAIEICLPAPRGC